MTPRIVSAFACEGPCVYAWFDDGATRRFDFDAPDLDKGRLACLNDSRVLLDVQVSPDGQMLQWDGGALSVDAKTICDKGVSVEAPPVEVAERRIISEIVRARYEHGMTQQKIAAASGLTQPAVARLESGVNSPRIDTILKVLAPMGKTLAVVDA